MKVLSVQKTVIPGEEKPIFWEGKMPIHPYRVFDRGLYSMWLSHIEKESLKTRIWNQIMTKITWEL